MTAHTLGWVEVPHPFWYAPGTAEWTKQGARWEGVLNLAPFLAWHAFTVEEWATLSTTMSAGFPDDVSERVRADYHTYHDQIVAFEAGILSSPQWAPLSHLEGIQARLRENRLRKSAKSDWTILMHILDLFARRYGDTYVRVTLWTTVTM